MRTLIAVFLLVVLPLFASADSHNFQRMASGLDEPWALAFLPDGQFLITERGGKLLLFDAAGKSRVVRQVPRVYVNGQGGLLDVVVSANFAANGLIYLSYAKKLSGGRAGTAVTRARLDVANARLRDVAEIFVMDTPSSGGRHFGSRIVEARDGSLFVTLGERGDRPLAQDNSTHNGTVIRIIIGDYHGKKGIVEGVAADPQYLDISVPAGVRKLFKVDTSRNAFAYVFEGAGSFRDASTPTGVLLEKELDGQEVHIRDMSGDRTLVYFDSGDEVTVQAGDSGIRFLLVSGAPIQEPVAWHGPIVMNTREELITAVTDLQNGTFIKEGATGLRP